MTAEKGFTFLAIMSVLNTFAQRITQAEYEKNNPFKCGWYGATMDEVRQIYNSKLAPFQLQANDVVANIGSGSGWHEMIWLTIKDSITFYAEDIDTFCMDKNALEKARAFYSKLRGAPITSKVEAVIGDEAHTHLPDHFFDKILVINTYHEFAKPLAILKDIYTKLKPNGKLLIKETVAQYKGQKHKICRIKLRFENDIMRELSESGFTFEKVLWENKKGTTKIFEFVKQ